jgi:hypothetical protein
MKTFNELIEDNKQEKEKSINEYIVLADGEFDYLTESERNQVQDMLKEYGDKKISELDEGILGRILGGVTGFLVGPMIGKVIANALGIQQGIIYDMLTSRLASAALGSALTKYMGSKK